MFSTLHIAEKTTGSRGSLALLRWALVVIFLWFGCMKFTSYEAMGIAPLMKNSPIMSWIPAVFGVQGGSYFIGTVELATAAALIIGAFNKASPQALYAEQRFSGHNVNIGVRQRREGTGRGFRG